MSREVVLKLVGLSCGPATEFDGEYLVEYDPDARGVDKRGWPMTAHIVTTRDVRRARRFKDAVAAMECWRQRSARWPYRDDGKPNRPLTAFSATIEKLPEEAVN